MANWVDFRLKPEALARYDLPDIAYPIPADAFHALLDDGGDLPLAVMLDGLQRRARDGGAASQAMEHALECLATLLAPDDDRETVTAARERWWLEIGPVDPDGKLVTIQRGDCLIAAIAGREDGRLRVAVFRPLDAKSAPRSYSSVPPPPRRHHKRWHATDSDRHR